MDSNQSTEFGSQATPDIAPADDIDAVVPTSSIEETAPPAESLVVGQDEERISIASNWTLVWWRFRKNKLAVISGIILIFMLIVVLVPDFFATMDPEDTDARLAFIPVQTIHWMDEGRLKPWVPGVIGARDPVTLKMIWTVDENVKIYIRLFGKGDPYKILGLVGSDIHLASAVDPENSGKIFLLGTDRLGRDQWSRLAFASRISMTIGMVSVAVSIVLGLILGGISGYFGGLPDLVIQRLIELLQSLPTIPIWLALTAALPRTWSPERVFFAITIILALRGWTTLAREVRGRFLSLREEDFVLAAELAGASQWRIILIHMIPTFTSHIIATSTLAIPVMIVTETSLSFLGLGLRPPAISWGVMLQEAQNIQTLALAPWLLFPGLVVIVAVLVFNLVGDGLRDAADPYGN
ncbi:MAG TPA: ABC transporter permease [Anaerolineales bacterium]|nr:ABC transporter permease [Anaerolineales bacterium]